MRSVKKEDAEDLKMAVYAAMIDRVDQNLGRLFAKLKELKKWDNTLIMFLSDNGACREQPNTTPNIPPGPVESYRTISVGWATHPTRLTANTSPLISRAVSSPFIAHWPRSSSRTSPSRSATSSTSMQPSVTSPGRVLPKKLMDGKPNYRSENRFSQF